MQGLGLGAVDGLRAECGQFGEGFAQRGDIAILAALGNVQQGAEPTPADRLLATRVVSRSLYQIADALASEQGGGWYVGLQASQIVCSPLAHMMDSVDRLHRRPRQQWWMGLRPVMQAVTIEPTA